VNVLVDASIWSLSLARRANLNPYQEGLRAELMELIFENRAVLLGPVRQQVLSRIPNPEAFERLRLMFRDMPHTDTVVEDHEGAAMYSLMCRTTNIRVDPTNILICAVAERKELAVFTDNIEFNRISAAVPVRLHNIRPELQNPPT